MSTQRQAVFWVVATVVLLCLLAYLRDILLPFVLGAAIAYFLDPVADRLQAAGLSRLFSTIIIVIAFVMILLTGALFLLPLLLEQLAGLITKLPAYIQSARDIVMAFTQEWLGDFIDKTDGRIGEAAANLIDKVTNMAGQLVGSVWSGGMALVNTFALLLVTPVVVFYLLLDWDRMVSNIDNFLPRDHAATIRRLAQDIDEVLSGFVRGQLTVLLILGLIYVVGLTLVGLNFGLLIGMGAALLSFVPYIGPLVGLVIGGIVAIVQFGSDWVPIAAVAGVFLGGQIIEGNVLSPLIVGDRVRLHPVWLIFALFVFAYIFGFVGMLLAVPMAAAIGVLVRFGLQQYQTSPLYLGHAGAASTKPATRSKKARRTRKQ
jgi:predicted PurR-regulated permease PerM